MNLWMSNTNFCTTGLYREVEAGDIFIEEEMEYEDGYYGYLYDASVHYPIFIDLKKLKSNAWTFLGKIDGDFEHHSDMAKLENFERLTYEIKQKYNL